MFKYLNLILTVYVLVHPLRAHAIFDWLDDKSEKIATAASYMDAAVDLTKELSGESDLTKGVDHLNLRLKHFERELQELGELNQETSSILSGPRYSKKSLLENIKRTSDYLKRFKKLAAKVALLGTKGTTALGLAETNSSLNAVQKNQQTLILLQLENNEILKRKYIESFIEAKRWQKFAKNLREFRSQPKNNGFKP